MSSKFHIYKNHRSLHGRINLTGSKSISNRALIIRALTPGGFPIERLATADDTRRLQRLLATEEEVYDAGPAGTTFRFLTAYLALQPGTQTLTGSPRMKQRPIGVLVDALRQLGANIQYLEKEGYPPLLISEARLDLTGELTISAGTSSQYISALLLIAPVLPDGLRLTLDGEIVSRPYIEMTLRLMAYFGIRYRWEGQTIHVPAQPYQGQPFTVEADWSAASYYYSMAALADEVNLQIDGLFQDSPQGDAVVREICRRFGIETTFNVSGLHLRRTGEALPPILEWNFVECPDIAQTVAVTCAGLGVPAVFTGLQTLKIKETDRIAALKQELAKVRVSLARLPPHFSRKAGGEYYMLEGKADLSITPTFETYDDHRMAMAFAPLGLLDEVVIEDPMVVIKSYPEFWADLESLGFSVTGEARRLI